MTTKYSNIFHVQRPPKIASLAGRFVYRKFQKNEYTDDTASEEYKVGDNYNRWIELDIDMDNNTIVPSNLFTDIATLELGNSIPTEADLNIGVVKAVTISRDENKYIKGFFGPNSSGRSPYQEYIIAYLGGYSVGEWPKFAESAAFPEVDLTTGKLVEQSELNPDYFQGPSWLSEYVADSIAGSILRNPLSEDKDAFSFYEYMSLVARKRLTEKNKRFDDGQSIVKLMQPMFNELSILTLESDNNLVDGSLIGYAVLKYDTDEFKSIEIIDTHKYYDYAVAYGREYRYIVLPIKAQMVDESTLIPVICNDEVSITITAEEKKSPEPPESISIKWQQDDLYKLSWVLGAKRITIQGEDGISTEESPDDTKGIQIFVRNSLEEPYALVRYLDFNDVEPPQYRELADENIPAEYIMRVDPNSTSRKTQFNIRLRPNSDHYIALCSIDAHGNSSGYSEQYKLRRNSVTGEVVISLVSPAGAPKNQPNLLLRKPLVESSFQASMYTDASIFFNPDLESSCPDAEASVIFEFFDVNSDTSDNFVINMDYKN